ncbi:MAG TPA: TetR family transcriptional regulator [Galbitalea sp.]|jgi:AcrR family transcriptional regulator|nr:TetR family transcriptional regulator [Galbitalea sp.]
MTDTAETGTDWRSAKKAATRARIRAAALELFRRDGYDRTTVERIAAAAGVTHTTFFRYFPTKEDVALSDNYDPLIAGLLSARPSTESIPEKICGALLEGLTSVYAEFRDELLEQMRLVQSVPALRARLWEVLVDTERTLLEVLDEDSLEARAVVSGIVAASTTIILAWAEANGRDQLPELLTSGFAALRRF